MKPPRTRKIRIYEYLFNLILEDETDGDRIISSSFKISGRLPASLTEEELRQGQRYQQRIHAGEWGWAIAKERSIILPTHDIIISVHDVQYDGSIRFGGGNIVNERIKEVCEHCDDPACYFDCPDSQEWVSDRDQDRCLENHEELAMKCHFNYACDAILSMVLAHAIAGINIESKAYLEGLETAIDAIGNNI